MSDVNVGMKVLDIFDEIHQLNECATLIRSSETGAAVVVDDCGGSVYLVDLQSMKIDEEATSNGKEGCDE